jgi:hypothetical protein
MRRALEVLIHFSKVNRVRHPNLQLCIKNYSYILKKSGKIETEIKKIFHQVAPDFFP